MASGPWQSVTCKGCAVQCRYSDYRGPLTWEEALAIAWARIRNKRAGLARDGTPQANRTSVLGILHEAKVAAWKSDTARCEAMGGMVPCDCGAPDCRQCGRYYCHTCGNTGFVPHEEYGDGYVDAVPCPDCMDPWDSPTRGGSDSGGDAAEMS